MTLRRRQLAPLQAFLIRGDVGEWHPCLWVRGTPRSWIVSEVKP